MCAKPGSIVGITTGLEGAGGFGKTMLAEMTCADERVREYFAGRVYVVTLGRDVRGPSAIAAKVIKAIEFITGYVATYTTRASHATNWAACSTSTPAVARCWCWTTCGTPPNSARSCAAAGTACGWLPLASRRSSQTTRLGCRLTGYPRSSP